MARPKIVCRIEVNTGLKTERWGLELEDLDWLISCLPSGDGFTKELSSAAAAAYTEQARGSNDA